MICVYTDIKINSVFEIIKLILICRVESFELSFIKVIKVLTESIKIMIELKREIESDLKLLSTIILVKQDQNKNHKFSLSDRYFLIFCH